MPDEKKGIEEQEIEIFRAGKYPQRDFNEDDLDQIANSYDPAVHEAPITVDHAKKGRAWGWVKSVRRVGDTLMAKLGQVNEAFAEIIKEGAYKKRSVELITNFNNSGMPYLSALTFLGAKLPQVKGMADIELSESDHGPVGRFEYREQEPETQRRIEEVADENKGGNQDVKSFSEEQIEAMLKKATDKVKKETKEELTTHFSETITGLQNQVESGDKKFAAMALKNRQVAFLGKCDALRRKGKFKQVWIDKLGICEFMDALGEEEEAVVKFGDKKQSPAEWFMTFLEGLDPPVNMGETDIGGNWEKGKKDSSAELNAKTLKYAEEHKVSYSAALAAVSSENTEDSFEHLAESGGSVIRPEG